MFVASPGFHNGHGAVPLSVMCVEVHWVMCLEAKPTGAVGWCWMATLVVVLALVLGQRDQHHGEHQHQGKVSLFINLCSMII